MKKKLTLLIALSILTASLIGTMIFIPAKPQAGQLNIESSTIAIEEEPEDDTTSSSIAIEEEIIVEEEQKIIEYPIAQEVWDTMKSFGWSDVMCAGIMGNMMRECAGNNFDLHWNAVNKSSGCYGLCQWTPMYHKNVKGTGVQDQLQYLKLTLENKAYAKNGRLLYYGNLLERLQNYTTPEAAAKDFFITYEWVVSSTPSQRSVQQRQANAKRAYEYFKDTVE